MAIENNDEVKEFVEKVSIEGNAGDGTDDDETIEAEPEESSTAKTSDEDDAESDDGTDTSKKDELVKKTPADDTKKSGDLTDEDLAVIPGETPRERALRLEVTNQKRINRQLMGQGLGIKSENKPEKKELSDDKKKVLAKYKPEDMQNLREVFGVLAEDMGFVLKDELGANTYTDKAGEELEKFLESHPEYLPENDNGNILWDSFRKEYALYKQPENPKDFKKIFDRVHQTVFGIKSAGDIKKIDASKEKVKVASHSGASKTTQAASKGKAPAGLRFDMLQGFSDEEKAELENSSGD